MAIEIKDLSLVAEVQDLQDEFHNGSTTSEIYGGFSNQEYELVKKLGSNNLSALSALLGSI
jgi:hypothetical protein